MDTKRISDEMEHLLNKQMTQEAYQAQVYLAFGSWAEINSFNGFAEFLYGHMQEERNHMFKILKYINDRGGNAKIEAIKAAPNNPKDMDDCLQQILKNEIQNSKEINKIVNLAFEEKDWATYNFGQWFVEEQIEEEALINGIIDKYNLASTQAGGKNSLYELDRDLTNASQVADIPRQEDI